MLKRKGDFVKKIICILSAIIVLVISSISFAARDLTIENEVAKKLDKLGLFKGISEGNYALEKELTRVEAVVMVIRLMGKENEALSKTWQHPFKDVPEWANGYIGYAYQNNLAKGVSKDEFGVSSVDCTSYLTYVLRALEYEDSKGTDFTWDKPYDLATKINLIPSIVDKKTFIRADAVSISYSSLNCKTKRSQVELYKKLINEKTIDQKIFEETYDFELLNKTTNTSANTEKNNAITNRDMPNAKSNSWTNEELNKFTEEMKTALNDVVLFVCGTDNLGNVSYGTAFFFNNKNYAVTNYHVVERKETINVGLQKNKQYCKAHVVSTDIGNDIAILYVEEIKNYQYLRLYNDIELYDYTFTCGYPENETHKTFDSIEYKTTNGTVLEKDVMIKGRNYIKSSNQTTHGNSGGPLLNGKYGVIGMVTLKDSITGEIYSVPSEKIIRLINDTDFSKFEKEMNIVNNTSNTTKSNKDRTILKAKAGRSTPMNLSYVVNDEISYEGSTIKIMELSNYTTNVTVERDATGNAIESTAKVFISFEGKVQITEKYGTYVVMPINIFNKGVLQRVTYFYISLSGANAGDMARFICTDAELPIVFSPDGDYEVRIGNP